MTPITRLSRVEYELLDRLTGGWRPKVKDFGALGHRRALHRLGCISYGIDGVEITDRGIEAVRAMRPKEAPKVFTTVELHMEIARLNHAIDGVISMLMVAEPGTREARALDFLTEVRRIGPIVTS